MNNQIMATLNIPAELASALEQTLAADGLVVEKAPSDVPAFGLEISHVLMILGGISSVASFIKSCLDIRKILAERPAAAHEVVVQTPSGASITIAAHSDAKDLERRLRAAFADDHAPV